MGSQNFIPRDYDVFAGLDVDKRSISITFIQRAEGRQLEDILNVGH
jgi:hypothetical protein